MLRSASSSQLVCRDLASRGGLACPAPPCVRPPLRQYPCRAEGDKKGDRETERQRKVIVKCCMGFDTETK